MQLLATGLSGLVGARLRQVLQGYSFTDLSLTTKVDITNETQVKSAFEKAPAKWVLHLAAMADVDLCEKEKELAYRINVFGTKNIVTACKDYGKKLIHISTDFVFKGDDQEYFEDSERGGVNYYGETKILGEDEVINGLPQEDFVILRLSHPYKQLINQEQKKSFFQRMYETLAMEKELAAVSDYYSRPTLIDDIATVIDKLIKLDFHGVLHCVGDSLLSGVEEAETICEVFNFDKSLIKPVLLDEYFKDRAKRPHRLNLNNDKIKRVLSMQLHDFRSGLVAIRKQMKI